MCFARELTASCRHNVLFVARIGMDGVVIDNDMVAALVEDLLKERCLSNKVSRYLKHLGLLCSPQAGSGFAVIRQRAQRKIKQLLNPPVIDRLEKILAGKSASYVLCSYQGLAKIPGFLARMRSKLSMEIIAFVHDILPIQYPEYFRPQQMDIFKAYLAQIVSVRGRFVCNSQDSCKNLQQYANSQGWVLPEVKIVCPQLMVQEAFREECDLQLMEDIAASVPYFVTLGTIEPRKNHLLLLHLWRELAQSNLEPMPHLHIVGKRGWENENIIDMLERCKVIQPYITEHNDLDDNNLFHLMQGACALLFPSFAEGLGLPLIEAQKLGVPVIASDLPVYHELELDNVTLLDPIDGKGWKDACLAEVNRSANLKIVSNG